MSFNPTNRHAPGARRPVVVALGLAGLLSLAACSPPGTPAATSTASSATATATAAAGAPTCGTDPVTLEAYVETGFPVFNDLAAEFSKQFPNVKFNTREDQFAVITANAPRVLVDSPPDLMRLPAGVRSSPRMGCSTTSTAMRRRSAGTSGPLRSSSRCV